MPPLSHEQFMRLFLQSEREILRYVLAWGFDSVLVNNLWGGKWAIEQAFRSRHVGGAHFAMDDGSLHFISDSIDYLTCQMLDDRRDGRPVSVSAP